MFWDHFFLWCGRYDGEPPNQGQALFFGWDYMMGLGKVKLNTIFEVAS